LVDDQSPTLRRRELAAQLRNLRIEAGLTVDEVAKALLCSPAKISRLETAKRPANLRDVRDLCALYGVAEPVPTRLMTLAREAKQQGWWHRYEDLSIGPLIGLEIEATRITSYESCVIPWMFQTKEYARTVIKGILPRISGHVLDERVSARLKRQEILTRESPPTFWSLVDESALRRRVGGNQVMYEQLGKMAELASMVPNVTLQVVPFGLGAHPGLDNTFTLLEFQALPSVVYVENLAGTLYVERPSDVERYEEALQHLRAGALDAESSLGLIEQIGEAYQSLPEYMRPPR
jgi:transcriptional regulator with XRE-family HTH domain